MRSLFRFFVFVVALFLGLPAGRAQVMKKELSGKLVALQGKFTQPAADSAFGEPKYIAFYFGAGWCGPCHKFTPDLVSFYKEMKPKHPEFDVVFVSRDTSAVEMQNYMAEKGMPWPAIRWDAVKFSNAVNQYAGPGIPCLVVVDQTGKVLSHSYEGEKYVGPNKVLTDLRKLLDQGEGVAAVANPASAAPGAPAGAPPVRTASPPSPSGTKWDEIFKKKSP